MTMKTLFHFLVFFGFIFNFSGQSTKFFAGPEDVAVQGTPHENVIHDLKLFLGEKFFTEHVDGKHNLNNVHYVLMLILHVPVVEEYREQTVIWFMTNFRKNMRHFEAVYIKRLKDFILLIENDPKARIVMNSFANFLTHSSMKAYILVKHFADIPRFKRHNHLYLAELLKMYQHNFLYDRTLTMFGEERLLRNLPMYVYYIHEKNRIEDEIEDVKHNRHLTPEEKERLLRKLAEEDHLLDVELNKRVHKRHIEALVEAKNLCGECGDIWYSIRKDPKNQDEQSINKEEQEFIDACQYLYEVTLAKDADNGHTLCKVVLGRSPRSIEAQRSEAQMEDRHNIVKHRILKIYREKMSFEEIKRRYGNEVEDTAMNFEEKEQDLENVSDLERVADQDVVANEQEQDNQAPANNNSEEEEENGQED